MADGDANDATATAQGRVTGLIVPPPDIRAVVDKTAQFVARNGRSFERKIAGETVSAKFSFLKPSDPYHAYYEHKVSEWIEQNAQEAENPTVAQEEAQEAEPAAAPSAPEAPAAAETAEPAATDEPADPVNALVVVEKKAVETVTAKVAKKLKEKALTPPEPEKFKIKHPQLSALDQEIMYLTAQYTALSGKTFLAGLATREQRNPQFDFLKPTHALFAYFTALVESYTQVLAPTRENDEQQQQMKRIEEGMDRMKVLDRCVHKLEWVRTEQERKDAEAAESDAERLALAQIDWHDFVVVETITLDDAEEEEAAAAAAAAQAEADKGSDDDMDMDEDSDNDDADGAKPDIKVVEDYVPLASSSTAATSQPLLTVDGKTVSSAEANEHMRILLMNPKWREETQRHLEKQKESSYAAGTAIADSLRRFATKRADIFASSAEEEARLLQATSTPAPGAAFASQQDEMDDDGDDDEQQQQQQQPGPSTAGAPGAPGAAPGPFGQPPAQFQTPGYSGALMQHGLPPGVAPGMTGPPGTMGPPGMMMSAPGMRGPPGVGGPPGVARPPPGIMMMGPPGVNGMPPGLSGPPGVPPGVSGPPGVSMPGPPGAPGTAPGTSAPQSTDDSEPAAKRQRTDATPTLLPEAEFAALHPGTVRLVVNVPQEPEHSQWKLEGQTLSIEVDIKDNIRTVKEKIMSELNGMPVNKQQLKIPVGFLKDTLTCAHYNFVNGTPLELSVRQRGGRR